MRSFLALFLITLSLAVSAQQYSFQKIGLEQGIPSSRVNDMLQDSRGFFWLATEGAGLVRYDGYEFKTYTPDNARVRPLFTSLCEDQNGDIWAASDNTLLKYDGVSFSYFYLPGNQRIKKISCAGSGRVLVSSDRQIFETNATDTLSVVPMKAVGNVYDLAFDGSLWMAADSGLFKDGKPVSSEVFKDIEAHEGKLYCAGNAGVKVWSGDWQILETLPAEVLSINSQKMVALDGRNMSLTADGEKLRFSKTNGLPDERLKGCYLSNSGVVWLYSNQGLLKLENTALRLFNEKQGVGPEVFSVWTDGVDVLAGTSHGVTVVKNGEIFNPSRDGYDYGVVLAMEHFDGQTWLGTERGLLKFDGKKYQEVNLPEIAGGYIFALKAHNDALYIGTGMGIFRYRGGRLINVNSSQGLPFSAVYAISEALDGSLWFATYTEGFMRLSEGRWENVREMGGVELDSLRFNSFTAVGANEIWAGTLSEGVYHISKNGFENLTASEVNFAEIKAMQVYDDRLWISTNKGLTTISKDEGGYKVREVSQVSRLVNESFSPQALLIKNGKLAAGGSAGLLTIDIDQFEKYVEPPKLAITDVELFFGEIQGLLDYSEGEMPFYGVPSNLDLPHDLNYLSFTMAGLTGYQPENLIYRYRLKGLTDNWTMAGSRREAIFTNIKPGDYTLQAQVTREGEEWTGAEVNYHFKIAYPLYQRWWFIVAMVLFLGSLTFIIISDRIKRANQQLRLENSLLEMERKALRLQMNPHFIFNALDSISSFIFKNDPKQAVRYLNNFAKLMRLTLESSMEHIHPVETEVSVLKNYLELEKLRFQGKFEYEIEVDEEIDYDVGIPPMLIQPHVENAILHGIKPKEGKSFLSIRFILDDELLICEVEDNGIGRKASKKLPKRQDHRSMATQINRDRIRLLRLSKSDEVDIQIIDLENPTGTKVIIKLPAESI